MALKTVLSGLPWKINKKTRQTDFDKEVHHRLKTKNLKAEIKIWFVTFKKKKEWK